MKNKKYIISATVIILLLVAFAFIIRHQRQTELAQIAPPTKSPWAVNIATVKQEKATAGFPAVAVIKGMNDIAVTPRLSGILLAVNVREGSYVAKGALLAKIDTQELKQQLKSLIANKQSAETDAKSKRRDADRAEKLLLTKGISQATTEQLIAAAKSAQEQVNSLHNQISAAKTHINYAQITAPFSGVISARMSDAGDFAAQGKPLFRLISDQGARLEVRLPANVLEKITKQTQIEISHNQHSSSITVDRIFPSVDLRSLGHIEIDLADKPFGLSTGALLHARIITQSQDNVLLIPVDALLPQQQVLMVVDNKITPVPVHVLFKAKEGIAITGNLQLGTKIVTAHESQLLQMKAGDTVVSIAGAL
jgi:RND family efflux transporter MFP subunit